MQMDESRESLAQKIEMLEDKVTETVQTATASVAEATASVLETVQSATASVSETVDSVTNAVQGTVDNVRQSVEGTVDSVKSAFDLSRQVEEHPWLMMGGAVAVGVLGATLLGNSGTNANARPRNGKPSPPDRSNGHVESFRDAPYQPSYATPAPASTFVPTVSTGETKQRSESWSWLKHLTGTFGPEITKLEGLALGLAMGALRDVVVDAVPPGVRKEVQEVIDGFTEKLGGERLPSHAFSSKSSE